MAVLHLRPAVASAIRRVHFHLQSITTSTSIKSTSEYTRNSSAELKMYRSWLDIPLHSVGPTQMVLP
jgi:hypothetical protein